MKKITLKGKVVSGCGDAINRMKQLEEIFSKKMPRFNEFSEIGGTLNLEISEKYPKKTIRGDGIIRFDENEIPELKNQNGEEYPKEGFTFIPIYKIQDEEVFAYIYSPDSSCNSDKIIEVMANFKIRVRYSLKDNDIITVETITDT